MLIETKDLDIKHPDFSPEIKKWILNWYKVWAEDKVIKDASYRWLGRTSLSNFWNTSRDNYDVIVPVRAKSDWKRQAKRTITRDEANGFISKLVKRIISPQVIAQNKNQEVDLEASRFFGILLEWWERKCKAVRVYIDAIQTAVVDGTVHVFQLIENGKETREVIPNDEIFIPNFFQSDTQKQTHLIRAHISTYDEAKLIWGDNDNWAYVLAGTPDRWNVDDTYFNDLETGLNTNDEVLIVYLWEHTGYDKQGKPKVKKYNVLINGIPMFDIDNTQNLKHNFYPVSKTVFEKFSRVNFYWGNSLPNKVKEDQKYLDAFRTIILNKALLNLGRPLFNKGNEHVDDDVIVPFKITPTQLGKEDIFTIEGIGDPITQADFAVEQVVEKQVREGTLSPVALGQGTQGQQTLGEIQIQDARSLELLEIFGQMASFLVEDMAEQSLSNLIQFEIKKDVQKLVNNGELLFKKVIEISNQPLNSGEMGTLALNFVPQEQQPNSLDVAKEEFDLKARGINKEIAYIDPTWFEELDKLIYVVGNPIEKMSKAMERLMAIETYKTVYFNNPNIDQREATRTVIRVNNDDETKLLAKPQMMPPEGQPGQGSMTKPTTRMKQSVAPRMAQGGAI